MSKLCEEEAGQALNDKLHSLLGWDGTWDNWDLLNMSVMEEAHQRTTTFLLAFSSNFLARNWSSRVQEYRKQRGCNETLNGSTATVDNFDVPMAKRIESVDNIMVEPSLMSMRRIKG